MGTMEERYGSIDVSKLADMAALEEKRLQERREYEARIAELEALDRRRQIELDDARKRESDLHQALVRSNEQRDQARIRGEKDSLTGLLNREGFKARFEGLLEWFVPGEHMAEEHRSEPDISLNLLVIDLDMFKPINDKFGHGVGDDALRHVASVLRQSVRDNDKVGRMGGDEFLVAFMSPKQNPRGSVTTNNRFTVSNHIRRSLEHNPFRYTDAHTGQVHALPVTASIGATEWRPGEEFDDVLKRADLAAKKAKEVGKNRVVDADVEEAIAAQKANPVRD